MPPIAIKSNTLAVDPTGHGYPVRSTRMDLSPTPARRGTVICAENIPIIFSIQGSARDLGHEFTGFFYLDVEEPFNGTHENWVEGSTDPSNPNDFLVDIGMTHNQTMNVTPQVTNKKYLYLVRFSRDGGETHEITTTDNLLSIQNNGNHNQVLVFTDSGWAHDPSGSGYAVYPIAASPDLSGVKEDSPTLAFTLEQASPEAQCPSDKKAHIPAKGFTGFRFMSVSNPGQWYRPTGGPGSAPENGAFSWVAPTHLPPDGEDFGCSMSVADACSPDDGMYIYVAEWVDVCGKHWVCDPKIKNQPPGWEPPKKGG